MDNSTTKPMVTRIAPSPTGFLHLGNCRTLLYNYFLAKQTGGKFLVRLEDTDRDRYNPNFLQYFRDFCDWLGIVPDYSYWNPDPSVGSFIQSERDYSAKVQYLLDNGYAYYAFDTKKDLEDAHNGTPNFKYDANTRMSMRNSLSLSKDVVKDLIDGGEKYVIRFAVPANVDVSFDDAILGHITINTSNIDDKVLIKSDGIAAYHLANTCDDHDMGVTHVLRGQEWVNSTPFHVLLYKAFGWEAPTFAHLPLIMNPDGKGKLSKRTASKYGIPIAPIGYTDSDGNWVDGWKELGFDPQVFINALSLIGWNPGDDTEIMSMDELISKFSLAHVNKSGAKFDMDKAKHFSQYYLNHLTPNSELMDVVDFNGKNFTDEVKNKIIDLSKSRSVFKKDLQHIVDLYTKDFVPTTKPKNPEFKMVFDSFVSENVDWSPENIHDTIKSISEALGVKMGKVMPDLRMAICGGLSGPDLPTSMWILGKEESNKRILSMIGSS